MEAAMSDVTWFSDETATLGDRLCAARDHAGLSQDGLAQRLGVRNTTVDAWENDQIEPRANRMQMLAGMLNVSLGWLMTGQGDGLAAPSDSDPVIQGDLTGLLADMRGLRVQISQAGDKLEELEKRLRVALREVA
jgi:HTH-type transcriptional regulator, cell division transcriptional repressor